LGGIGGVEGGLFSHRARCSFNLIALFAEITVADDMSINLPIEVYSKEVKNIPICSLTFNSYIIHH
jgi:hypothetical protein